MHPAVSGSPSGSGFRLGDRTVHPGLNRIDGPGGPVQVEPKVMEVLVHLAGRQGEVTSKEELVRVVWEGRFVSDDVVWRSIRELRRALGDDAHWIETIPKKGYRLVVVDSFPPLPEGREGVGEGGQGGEGPRLVPRRLLGLALAAGFALLLAIVLLGVRRQLPGGPDRLVPAAESPAAHDAVLRGRDFLSRGMPEDLRKSRDAYREAVTLDPGSAAAWAGLADSLHLLVLFGAVAPREGIPPAEEAARKALALDDRLAGTHATLGTIRFRHHWDWRGGEAEIRRALELDPRSAAAHHDLAWLLLAARRFDEAIAEILAAQELEPMSVRANADVGWVYYRARRYGEAIRQMERTLEMEPRLLSARRCLEGALLHAGRPQEAFRQAREAARQEGIDAAELAALETTAAQDPLAALRRLTKRRLTHLIGRGSTVRISSYALAALHAELGDREAALAALGRALAERDPMIVSLDVDPAFDAIRPDPRFDAIVAEVGDPDFRRRT